MRRKVKEAVTFWNDYKASRSEAKQGMNRKKEEERFAHQRRNDAIMKRLDRSKQAVKAFMDN